MWSWILSKVAGTALGGAFSGTGLAITGVVVTALTGAYLYHNSLLSQIEELEQANMDALILVEGKTRELNNLNNENRVLSEYAKGLEQENVESDSRVQELSLNIKRVRDEHNKQILVWDKKFNKMAVPFQNRPHKVIKLINRGTKRVLNNLTEITTTAS